MTLNDTQEAKFTKRRDNS